MDGLFLQGGGAKGAFQAGVLYALVERGVNPKIIAGTSVGAINGYYLYTDNLEKMKDFYINFEDYSNKILSEELNFDKVVDNSGIIEILKELKGINKNIKAFYVNYVKVENGVLQEKIVDICKLENEEKIDAVKFSSLLPYCSEQGDKKHQNPCMNFNTVDQIAKFKESIVRGGYDGYNLDGGVLNNCLLTPFIDNKVSNLYLLSLNNKFDVPCYIRKNYINEDIILIRREAGFRPEDTLNFEKTFLKEVFYEGYKKGNIVDININS